MSRDSAQELSVLNSAFPYSKTLIGYNLDLQVHRERLAESVNDLHGLVDTGQWQSLIRTRK